MTELLDSIPATLRRTAAEHADLEAVVDGDVRLTYRDLDDAVLGAARALLSLGVRRGDRVVIWAQNSWQWSVAALGIVAVGAVIVPINTRFRGREAAQIIGDSQPVLMFTTTGFLDADYPSMLRNVAPEHDDLRTVVMSGPVTHDDLCWPDFLTLGATVAEHDVLTRIDQVRPDDLSDIMYTSGTTGNPKGVMQTHGKNLQAVTALGNAVTLRAGDRTLTIAPMFAQFGLRGGLYIDVLFAATTVIEAVFDAASAIDVIERERITFLPGPPTILAALISPRAVGRDVSSLRVALMGSTTVPEELVTALLDKGVFDHVLVGWGLTEACGIVSISGLDDSPGLVATSAGKVVDHVQLKVVDAEGDTVPAGVAGRLLVRGPTVMVGYLGDEVHTAEILDAEGWLDTGDIGSVDAEGFVRITGRAKDMVIVGGFNVYPAEVEAAMRTHPAVADVALVGMPDERLGEVVAAFVVAREPGCVDVEEFIRWCRTEMANHKVPRAVVTLDDLPLNSSLKVDKPVLRARAAALAAQPIS